MFLNINIDHIMDNHETQVGNLKSNLDFVGPLSTLNRGYSILTKNTGDIVDSVLPLTSDWTETLSEKRLKDFSYPSKSEALRTLHHPPNQQL